MRELSHTQPLPEVDIARLRPALRTRTRNLRACTICGAPAIGSRCTKHPLERGTTTQRGYGSTHQAERTAHEPAVATGTVRCAHPDCGELIHPDEPWHLGHNANRTGYLGPMHQRCNCNTAKAA